MCVSPTDRFHWSIWAGANGALSAPVPFGKFLLDRRRFGASRRNAATPSRRTIARSRNRSALWLDDQAVLTSS